MVGKPPRYSLTPTEFPFQALAALAGRSQLGGTREVTLATLVAARLASGAIAPFRISVRARESRAAAARNWILSLAIPTSTRLAFQKAFEASGTDDVDFIGESLSHVLELADQHLDQPSRLELGRLVHRISQERSSESLEHNPRNLE